MLGVFFDVAIANLMGRKSSFLLYFKAAVLLKMLDIISKPGKTIIPHLLTMKTLIFFVCLTFSSVFVYMCLGHYPPPRKLIIYPKETHYLSHQENMYPTKDTHYLSHQGIALPHQ